MKDFETAKAEILEWADFNPTEESMPGLSAEDIQVAGQAIRQDRITTIRTAIGETLLTRRTDINSQITDLTTELGLCNQAISIIHGETSYVDALRDPVFKAHVTSYRAFLEPGQRTEQDFQKLIQDEDPFTIWLVRSRAGDMRGAAIIDYYSDDLKAIYGKTTRSVFGRVAYSLPRIVENMSNEYFEVIEHPDNETLVGVKVKDVANFLSVFGRSRNEQVGPKTKAAVVCLAKVEEQLGLPADNFSI